MKKWVYILLISSLALAGCISLYEQKGIDEIDNILIVEGMITEGTTTIKLSRSVQLSSQVLIPPRVYNARVTVECEDGTTFTTSGPGTASDGTYSIEIDRLYPEKRYRLKIESSGLEYESDFRHPQPTPPIDEINHYKKAKGEPIEMRVSTTGDGEESSFYLWSYEAVWEIRAFYYSEVYLNDEDKKYYPCDPAPYYYCWAYDNSQRLLLGSTAKNRENMLRNYPIAEFEAVGDRFKFLYWVKIRQNMISKDAYEYFSTLQKNADNAGSVFAPIISEMKGNIICTTDEDVPVIGFVDVSYTTTAERYEDESSNLAEYPERAACREYSLVDIIEQNLDPQNFRVFKTFLLPPDSIRARVECVDCRKLGGSKTRPDFWPNDHF